MASLKKSFLYQTLYQVLIVILPLITAPYIARVLGRDNSGVYSFTHTIANYFVVFGMLGLEQYGNRCIAKARDDQEELNKTFSELFYLHAIVSVVAILFYFVYCFTIANEYRDIFIYQGFWVVSVIFDINWFYFGIEKFKLTVIRNTIIKTLSVIAMFVFVKTRDDLAIYTIILASSMLISQIAIWPTLRRYTRFVPINECDLRKHWKPMLILFVAVIAANLNRMIDKAMLGWFDKITDLGCYDYADRIIRIPLSLIAAVGTVMLSRMANLAKKDDKTTTKKILDASACLVLILSFGMGFGLAAIAPEFIIWYLGEEYAETVILLMILSASIPLVGWNNYIRTQVLIPREMDSVYTRAVTIGAAVNIIINCFLIYFLGARGASIATVISYAIILVIQIIPIDRDIKKLFKYALFPLISGAVMYLAVRLSASLATDLFISVCIELGVGVVVYGCLSLIYLKIKQPQLLKTLIKR